MQQKKKGLTIPDVSRMLLDHRVITSEQHRYILAHGEAQIERLRSYQQGGIPGGPSRLPISSPRPK